MIVESPASLRLMTALLDVGPAGTTREHLIRKADIGTTTFYRLIGPLVEHGLVITSDNRYQVPLNNPYNLRFKLWYDMERLFRLPDEDRNAVLDIATRTRHELGNKLRCLWLVGSAAQDQLTLKSDLDFLAVTTRDSHFHPSATRKVNFVSMAEERFRDLYRRADGFIASALRYGIVLFERDFVQEFYAVPPPVTISPSAAHDEEQATEQLRGRFLQLVKEDRLDEARTALQAFATSVGRLLLRAFGELPPSRATLSAAAKAYFGRGVSASLSRALEVGELSKKSLVNLSRELSDYHHTFQQHVSHLTAFAALPSADPVTMQALCARVLSELAPGGSTLQSKDGDAVTDLAGQQYVFQAKSLSAPLSAEHVRGPGRRRDRRKPKMLLIANGFRDLPPLERGDAFTAEARKEAAAHDVALITGLELLRAHNTLHLESIPAAKILKALLSRTSAGG